MEGVEDRVSEGQQDQEQEGAGEAAEARGGGDVADEDNNTAAAAETMQSEYQDNSARSTSAPDDASSAPSTAREANGASSSRSSTIGSSSSSDGGTTARSEVGGGERDSQMETVGEGVEEEGGSARVEANPHADEVGRRVEVEVETSPLRHKAAVRIQSVHRGRATRKRLAVEAGFTARCECVLLPERTCHVVPVRTEDTIHQVKQRLSDVLKMPIDTLQVMHQGSPVNETTTLAELGVEPGGGISLELSVAMAVDDDTDSKPAIDTPRESPPFVLPEILQVAVDDDAAANNSGGHSSERTVTVRIIKDECRPLPFAGGYRDKRTGVEYLNAGSQTRKKPLSEGEQSLLTRRVTRETQTAVTARRCAQTQREAATQMARPDLLIDTSRDKLLTPGPYVSSSLFHLRRLRACLTLQRFLRGWLSRRLRDRLRLSRSEGRRRAEEEARGRREREEREREREVGRRMRPRRKEDFEVLWGELGAWVEQETRKIKEAGLEPEDKQNAMKSLLAKETKLLQTIDRLRTAAAAQAKDARVDTAIADMAAPRRWNLRDGGVACVHTPTTTRAHELGQLYAGLRLPLVSADERLDVLLHVKWAAKEFDCDLTRELVSLIDREADLISRGRPAQTMKSLRARIAGLFLQFLETPEFNPGAAKYQITAANANTGAANMKSATPPAYQRESPVQRSQ
eukprot:jgi/Chlat1/5153/Chrsp33S05035